MHTLNYNQTYFLQSFSNVFSIPNFNSIEIAFVGYSNSGKSSVINALTNKKKLARCSKIPGRTQLINFFEVNSKFKIVDLPGYGYSCVPEVVKLKWQKILYHYLEKRDELKGIVILMDIRHPLKILDYKIFDIIMQRKHFFLILLTKCDKITSHKQKIQLKIVQKKLHFLINKAPVLIFSSTYKIGISSLKNILNSWYNRIYI